MPYKTDYRVYPAAWIDLLLDIAANKEQVVVEYPSYKEAQIQVWKMLAFRRGILRAANNNERGASADEEDRVQQLAAVIPYLSIGALKDGRLRIVNTRFANRGDPLTALAAHMPRGAVVETSLKEIKQVDDKAAMDSLRDLSALLQLGDKKK